METNPYRGVRVSHGPGQVPDYQRQQQSCPEHKRSIARGLVRPCLPPADGLKAGALEAVLAGLQEASLPLLGSPKPYFIRCTWPKLTLDMECTWSSKDNDMTV